MLKKVLLLVALFSAAFCVQAQEPASLGSDLNLVFGKVDGMLKANLDANSVLGVPVTAGDVTLVPIIIRGFGFGVGERNRSESEVKTHDKASVEEGKDNKGIGAGAGGFARPIAILVIKKDGSMQVHRLQPESWISQAIHGLVPVFQNMINKRFEARAKAQEQKAAQEAAPKP